MTKRISKEILEILEILFLVSIPALFFFIYLWQNIQYTNKIKELKTLSRKKEMLIRKNDDLKIGITTFTSAKRIEALYRKTYNYLPISIGKRIETVILPPEKYNESR